MFQPEKLGKGRAAGNRRNEERLQPYPETDAKAPHLDAGIGNISRFNELRRRTDGWRRDCTRLTGRWSETRRSRE